MLSHMKQNHTRKPLQIYNFAPTLMTFKPVMREKSIEIDQQLAELRSK